jgi:HSP20 family molecular chaperone IbpA
MLTALAEMPGAAAETLDLVVDGDILTVRARSDSVEYHAEAMLPVAIEPASRKVTLRNGVLEATWRRPPTVRAES